jgi:hypothetical protein
MRRSRTLRSPWSAASRPSSRQRVGQQRRKRLGVLLADQLRGEVERLLGVGQIAGLVGLARLIHRLGDVVGEGRSGQ